MDDPEGFKEGINDINHQQKESHRRQERQDDGEETSPESSAVNGGGFNDRARHGLKGGKEKQEIVTDSPPGGCNNDQPHRFAPVKDMVPIITDLPEIPGHQADAGIEHEKPQDARNGRCNRIRPD